MPTYQYACTECGHAFEQVQSFSEDALTVCPECQGRLRKVFNAVGVVFKGSGFYRTDSRRRHSRPSRPPRSPTPSRRRSPTRRQVRSSKSETKSTPKADAKPAAASSSSTDLLLTACGERIRPRPLSPSVRDACPSP